MQPTTSTAESVSAGFLAELRAEMGRQQISQAQLAERVDVNPVWLHRRMTGTVALTLDDAARLAAPLGVSVVDLLGRAA